MFTPQELLRQLLPCMDAPAWWLGLSGGMDSMVLLESLAELGREHALPPLRAIHVHHGLHPDADGWAEHCLRETAARNLPLLIEHVQILGGASIEAQARDARYAAFSQHMGAKDCLLLAHHRDDQLETLLFRILRGTGLRGLAGMPASRPLSRGKVLRPLLEQPRSALLAWAEMRGLTWIEDPANYDPRFARSALRHDLLPRLRQGWPAVDSNLLMLASHVREANELLDERAAEDMQLLAADLKDPWLKAWPSLQVPGLLTLSSARRSNLLRYWLRSHGLRASQRRLQALDQQLAGASDSQPIVELEGARVHRSSGRLWLVESNSLTVRAQRIETQGQTVLEGNNGIFALYLPAVARDSLIDWTVKYRSGGEQIRLPGRPAQSLKHLLQEADIPTWLRARIPLVYHADELVSVGGRWNAAEYLQTQAGEGWFISWEPHRRLFPGERTGSED